MLAGMHARKQNMQELDIAALHVAKDFVLDSVSNEVVHVFDKIR